MLARCSWTKSLSTGSPCPGTTTEPSPSIDTTRSRVAGQSSGKQSSPKPGTPCRTADSSTRSPASTTSASGTRTTASPAVWPRPGCSTSTSRSPRSTTRAEEKVCDGTSNRVDAMSACRASLVSASASRWMRRPASCRSAAASSWMSISAASYSSEKTTLPNVWSKWWWVLTTATTDPAAARRISSRTDLAAASEVWVSTTSSPRSPPTRLTLTSRNECRANQTRSATSTKPTSEGTDGGTRRPESGMGLTLCDLVVLALETSECQPLTPVVRRTRRGGAMVEDRKLAVLRAIVEDYVATQEPVGSKALVERHRLGVSPATVRNDMAALEDEGFITQPHTSAGRVPTDKGYRLFVDRLGQVKPLSTAERRAIMTLLEGAIDLDDVVQRSVRLLAQLTRQVAIVQYPTLSRSTVRHVELVVLTAHRLLLVLILSTGRVEQRIVELPEELTDERVGEMRTKLNQAVVGQRLTDASERLVELPDEFEQGHRAQVALVVAALVESMSDHRSDERVLVGGTANLARFGEGFDASIKPMLEALEEHVVLLKL